MKSAVNAVLTLACAVSAAASSFAQQPGKPVAAPRIEDYVERPSRSLKRNVVLCHEEGFDYFDQLKRFADKFFPDKHNLVDGNSGRDTQDATYIYVGHYPLSEKSLACAKKYPALISVLDSQVSEERIKADFEKISENTVGPPELRAALRPFMNSYADPSSSGPPYEALAILCHVAGRSCVDSVPGTMFWVKADFCQNFDCDSVFTKY